MDDKLLREEERRLRRLRLIIDTARAILMQSDLTLHEALHIMYRTKYSALRLFPDKEDVYDLIYTPRFQRILAERFAYSGSTFSSN